MNSLYEQLLSHPLIAYPFFGLIALAVGSLLNVIIYRLPLMLQTTWRAECCNLLQIAEPPPRKMNLFFPRSFCTHCNTMIPFWHNIPVISYCLLLGRCRACRHPISLQYPLVELVCLGLSLLSLWHFGFGIKLLFAAPFIWIMITLFFIDLKHQILPDCLTLSLLWLGLIANTENLFTPLPTAIYSAAGAYLGLWLFIKLFYLITGKIGMGNGDFKLFAAFGAWFGWSMLPLILFVSSLTGALIGIVYLKSNKHTNDTPIPFGPFLCMCGILALLYGDTINFWYLNILLANRFSVF
jgi:leader peptidase (prepilin peptidase)/N-methyltransferase